MGEQTHALLEGILSRILGNHRHDWQIPLAPRTTCPDLRLPLPHPGPLHPSQLRSHRPLRPSALHRDPLRRRVLR